MVFLKIRLLLLIAIMIVSLNITGQTDSAYTSKYYNNKIEIKLEKDSDNNEQQGEKTFKPFIKQVKINSQKLMINSSQLVQINNEFWFVNKDSLFTIDIEGQIRNGFRLIDPVLNNLHNKDLVLGLSFNGEFIFAVNNDTNKTIFVIIFVCFFLFFFLI